MLLYPISCKMYYILLTEQTYAVMVFLVLCTAAVTLLLTRSNRGRLSITIIVPYCNKIH
jgi:uncharacterized membrane protein